MENELIVISTTKSFQKAGWTEQDMDMMVQKYNEQNQHKAPLMIGQPNGCGAAYGYVDKLERRGDMLYAKYQEVAPEFTEWATKKDKRRASIGVYPDKLLRHVSFLEEKPTNNNSVGYYEITW
jgi:hypothetical protein